MIPEECIAAGMPAKNALAVFRDNVNKPGTMFSTDHWLFPKLERLQELLHDPITADQAQALLDVLYKRHWMRDLFNWLEAPPIPWRDFFEYWELQERGRELREREEAWEHWQQFQKWNELNTVDQPDKCPDCGSDRILPIAYGHPSSETEEAARRGKVALGGCILRTPRWCCQACYNSWPEVLKARSLVELPNRRKTT